MRGSVKPGDLVLLWARAAGRCSHPDCRRRLVVEASESDPEARIGEAAHMVARVCGGPRGTAPAHARGLNSYENLILLCPSCHGIVDRQASTYTVETLRGWKAEHESWVQAVTEPEGRDVPWTGIVQQEFRRVDVAEAKQAVGAGNSVEEVVELRTSPERSGWTEAAWIEATAIESLLARVPTGRRRFAVFSLGRIPMAVQLGYLMQDRARVRLFQYDRDRGSWAWPEVEREGGRLLEMKTVKTGVGVGAGSAALRVSLSGRVPMEDAVVESRAELDIEIAADHPSVRWLRWPEQLLELSKVYEEALTAIREHGGIELIHLFYAGPAAGAVCFGRAYHAHMNPKLALYEYSARRRPQYERVLTVNV